MSNDLQIKKRVVVVKERMLEILRNLASQLERGLIKSPAELQHRAYQELQSFYESIGKPTFHPIEAWGAPYSSDHNQMMEQILTDLYTMYREMELLTQDIQENFEQVEVERQSFLKRINEIESYMQTVESKIKEDLDVIVFRDDFANIEKYAKESVRGIPAYLSADERILTLNRIHGEEFNEHATITIIKGNGLPGNTHIVRSIGNALKFDGENDLHINLANILDGNADTWFEFEIFQISDAVEQQTQNKDFRYKEPIEWVKRDLDALRCVIQIELSKPKNMNWFSISPYIPSDKGAMPAQIEKVVISDEKGTLKALGFEEKFNQSKAYIFPRQKCRTITIYLRQDIPYPCTIGHFYYKQINREQHTVLDQAHLHDSVRVHGKNPSIENLSVSYDTSQSEIIYPIVSYGDTIEDEITKKQSLFTPSQTAATGEPVVSGIEQLPAYRYIIGVRDVKLACYQFDETSEYVSKPFITDKPIREISIDVFSEIPENFPEGEWIHYYISIDQGQSWYPIYPKDVYMEGAKTHYLINSKTPKEGRLKEFGYLESIEDVYEVQFKIELKRPTSIEDAEFYSPTLFGYELHVLV